MNSHSTSGGNNADIISVIDPSTEEKYAEVSVDSPKVVDEVVGRARETFRSRIWRDKPAPEKARILNRAADIIEKNKEELIAIDSRNTGMTTIQVGFIMDMAVEMVRYNAGWCTKLYGITNDIKMSGGITGQTSRFHAYTIKEPMGVAGLIVPFNGPIYVSLGKIAPALAAGCSCVLKPSSYTPLSGPRLVEMFIEAGVPEGVVNVVNGYGHTTGDALAAHPDVDKVSFTGSVEVGKKIAHAAVDNLKRVVLELGGKSPVLVYDDADISMASLGAAVGIFSGSGQGCCCGSRIYVQRGIYAQFVEGISQIAKSLRLGGSQEKDVELGPIISEKQLERVMGFIDEGKQEGAEVVTGGKRIDRKGYFVQPTVLTNVRHESRLMREEIFGPVVAVVPFDDEEEAFEMANDTSYGLAAGVWTRDIGRAHRAVKRLEAGMQWINSALLADPSMPFGGYKQSGWGYEYGWKGIDAYLHTKTVFADISS